MKKGMVTLTALILLSGLLALILLFDEQIFAFFRSQMSQRKYYVEQSLALQKISQQQQKHICQNLPLNGAEKVKQVFFESSGAWYWCYTFPDEFAKIQSVSKNHVMITKLRL